MKGLQAKIIFVFVLAISMVSLIIPAVLIYRSNIATSTTARASAAGSVDVTVNAICGDGTCDAGSETCSSCSADCGVCAAGGETPAPSQTGGGGGGAPRGPTHKYVTHMLDFRLNDWYVLTLFRGDKVITVFDDKTMYRFNVEDLIVYDYLLLKLEESEISYRITWGEKGLFDFDNDGVNDLEITFLDKQVRWLNLGLKIEEPSLFPGFEKEPYEESKGVKLGQIVKRFDFIILVVILLVLGLVIFVYHQIKIHTIEKRYTKQIHKLSKDYGKSKFKKNKDDLFRLKLEKQKRLLKEAYDSKYISQSSYKKGMQKLDNMLRKT